MNIGLGLHLGKRKELVHTRNPDNLSFPSAMV